MTMLIEDASRLRSWMREEAERNRLARLTELREKLVNAIRDAAASGEHTVELKEMIFTSPPDNIKVELDAWLDDLTRRGYVVRVINTRGGAPSGIYIGWSE